MAFDFPASPSEGQIFTPPGGPTYTYQAPVWKALGQGQFVYIGDTPPLAPLHGHLWWQSSTGKMFVYYDDGTSKQWVIAAPQGAPGADAIAGIVVSKAYNTRRDAMTVPANWTNAWLISQGIQILQIGLNVKSASSKLLVRGGLTAVMGGTSTLMGVSLFTSLSANMVGAAAFSQSASWTTTFVMESDLIAHGQSVGTYITAQMRAAANGSTPTAQAQGAPAWLSLEEVMI